MSSEDIVNTHNTFMKSFGIELSDDDKKLPYLYWTPKLHKSPVKLRFIAGSSNASVNSMHQHHPPPGKPPGFCTLLLLQGQDLYLMTLPGGRVFAYP